VLLAATDIVKRFAENGVVANDHATLHVVGGSVHAVVGENGAGKSTLMHIIAGSIQPDVGRMTLRGKSVQFRGPADALAAGIVISFQHPRLVPSLTVWENLVLGAEPRTAVGTISRRAAKQRITSRSFGISGIDLDARVNRLSSGQVRLVSLMAAMLRLPTEKPGILILDEPTAACGPNETDEIIAAMRATAAAEHGVIYITHKIAEVTAVADTVTVMKEGSCIATLPRPFTTDEIARLMLGGGTAGTVHEASSSGVVALPTTAVASQDARRAPGPPAPTSTSSPAFAVRGVTLREGTRVALDNVSFSVRAGEILGLTGIRQSGIEAIEEVLGGMRRPSAGTITFNGRNLTGLSPHALRRSGVGYVPTDRLLRGASMESSVAENLIVLERKQLQRAGLFLPRRVHRYGRRLTEEFKIEGILHTPLNRLSGGNIQKVILGRELAEHLSLLIICEPSWGLDIRSRELIVDRIRSAADAGAAVILISTDMDEVLDFADSVGAFHEGKLSEIVPVGDTDRQTLGRLVFGSTPSAEMSHA